MGRWGAIFVVVRASVGRVGRLWGELRRIGAAQRTQHVLSDTTVSIALADSNAWRPSSTSPGLVELVTSQRRRHDRE